MDTDLNLRVAGFGGCSGAGLGEGEGSDEGVEDEGEVEIFSRTLEGMGTLKDNGVGGGMVRGECRVLGAAAAGGSRSDCCLLIVVSALLSN